jgi:carboxylate-amine ligase
LTAELPGVWETDRSAATLQLGMPRTGLTLGVEEEFYLVDRRTHRLAPVDPGMMGLLQRAVSGSADRELARCQVEVSTPVCRNLDAVRGAVSEQRRDLSRLAAEHDQEVLCSATPILEAPGPPPLADDARYQQMNMNFRILLDDQGVSGCHVHVGIPDREMAVLAGNYIRAWLPVLLAVTTNSPFCEGRDTGYQSWRHQLWSRWPTAGPPPSVDSVGEYDEILTGLRLAGAISEERDAYWFVRASAVWPTIEVRIADVLPTVDDVVGYAGLVRALVRRSIDDLTAGKPYPRVPDAVLRAQMWRAARDGMRSTLTNNVDGTTKAASDLLRDLIEMVRLELECTGDDEAVGRFVFLLEKCGTGADRQRQAYHRSGSLRAVARDLMLG